MERDKELIIRSFEYDPFDVAVAFKTVVDKEFGSDPFIGAKTKWWHVRGPVPFTSVRTGPNLTVKVVVGEFEVRQLGFFSIQESVIQAVVGKTDSQRVERFLDEVERKLKSASIYKGKFVTFTERGPEFHNIENVDFSKLIYNPRVERELNEHLLVLIEKTAECKADGLLIQRKVLFEGRFGTGKTMALLLTIKKALENGLTVFYLNPTVQNVAAAIPPMLKLSKKYSPALLAIEDFDREQEGYGDRSSTTQKIMTAIDGVLSKDAETIIVLTTNFGNKIKGGFKRPGRIDKVINFDIFDIDDAKKLLRTAIAQDLLSPSIDWEKVGSACSHMAPAFIRGISDTAKLAARSRAKTGEKPLITENILLDAIEGLQAQHKACEDEMQMGFSQNR